MSQQASTEGLGLGKSQLDINTRSFDKQDLLLLFGIRLVFSCSCCGSAASDQSLVILLYSTNTLSSLDLLREMISTFSIGNSGVQFQTYKDLTCLKS